MPSLCSAGDLTQGLVWAHYKLSYIASPLYVGVCVCHSVDGGQITALGGQFSPSTLWTESALHTELTHQFFDTLSTSGIIHLHCIYRNVIHHKWRNISNSSSQ